MGEFAPRDLTPVEFQHADNSTSLFLTSLKDEIVHEKTTESDSNGFTDEDYLNENSFRPTLGQAHIGCTASEVKRPTYLISSSSSTTNSMFHDFTPGNLWSPPTPEDIHSQTMALSLAENISYTSNHHFHTQKPRIPGSTTTTTTNQQKRATPSYSFLPVASPKPSSNLGWNVSPAQSQPMSGWQHFPATPPWAHYHSSPSGYVGNQVSAIGQRNGLHSMSNGRPSIPSSNRFHRGQRSTNNGYYSRSVSTSSVTESLQGMTLGERPIDGTIVSDLGIPGISGNLTELSNSLYMVGLSWFFVLYVTLFYFQSGSMLKPA